MKTPFVLTALVASATFLSFSADSHARRVAPSQEPVEVYRSYDDHRSSDYRYYDKKRDYRYYEGSKRTRRDVQRELARRGYYRGPIDGDLGKYSRRAIRNYQIDRRLPVSGRIDYPLMRSLRLI